MSIPKSKREQSKLQVVSDAYKIRKKLTDELLRDFGYKEKDVVKKYEHLGQKMIAPEQREDWVNAQVDRTLTFNQWFIHHEREVVLDLAREIPLNLVAANSIFPVNMTEFEERRLCLDRALQACNKLQQELQYIVETLPVDVNKYTNIVLEVEEEYHKIKALRKSDNRFLKYIKQ